MEPLVSTEWLAAELGAADLRVLDATGFLPEHGRDAGEEYEAAHIPGARFFDLKDIVDSDHPAPAMLPGAAKFASRMRALGLGDHDRIVIYDNSPLHTAARAWWMLRTFGARSVAILDGGLQKWQAEGRPVESGPSQPGRGHFTPVLDEAAVADKHDVAGLVGAGTHEIVDARSAARFRGEEPETRAGVEPGHIPTSKNLHYAQLFNADGTFKHANDLRAAFDAEGVDLGKPMVATCGSGVTACVVLFAAGLLGKDDVSVYDGSWSEWGGDPDAPKAKGPA